MRKVWSIGLGILLSPWIGFLVITAAVGMENNGCEPVDFGGNAYLVCTADPNSGQLRLFWQDSNSEPYRTFAAVADAVDARGGNLVFAFNAGMYLNDFSPMGLYIEDGEELHAINTRIPQGSGAGVPNFYKSPNGVFFLGASGAGLMTTSDFLHIEPDVSYATQSGPMLVVRGELNPILIEGSTDRKRRTGIGVCEQGLVRIAISDGAVNFHDFASMFRDWLYCPEALFLDGGRGAGVYQPDLGRNDVSWHGGFGPIIGSVRE